MIPFVFCLIFDVVLNISSGGGERVGAGRRMRTVIELLFLKLSKLKLTWLWWWYFQQLVIVWKAHSGNLRHHHLFTLDNNFLIMLYRACLHLFAGFVFENSTSHLMKITCQSWIILRPVINKFFILTSVPQEIESSHSPQPMQLGNRKAVVLVQNRWLSIGNRSPHWY